jgi:HlyD family secretion protein
MIAELLASVLALFGTGHAADKPLQGYVEGDYVRVGSPVGGTLETLPLCKGDKVGRGQTLFRLDSRSDQAARDQAAAQLAQAEAQLADLQKGKRPAELAAIAAQKAQAEADLELARLELQREERLVRSDAAARARLDEARATFARTQARVAQLAADYETANLAARPDRLSEAAALVAQRSAELAKAEQRLRDLAPPAPADAVVDDVLYQPGEVVPAGAPVVSLLPPGNIKLVFFVSERRLGAVHTGDTVRFSCDACPADLSARIDLIGTQAEYTPPVIYSVETRSKLVYRVEARPLGDALILHPGQPVDVTLP